MENYLVAYTGQKLKELCQRADQPYIELTEEQAAKIVSIQIKDSYDRPYAASIISEESMHDRSALGVIGVEVISDAYLSDAYLNDGLDYTTKYTFDNTVKVLGNVWPEALLESK